MQVPKFDRQNVREAEDPNIRAATARLPRTHLTVTPISDTWVSVSALLPSAVLLTNVH